MPAGAPRATHWDFMVERDGALRTWALEREPADGVDIAALALADHRLAYLEYEGPVSGNRGEVSRLHGGVCRVKRSDADVWEIEIAADQLRGQVLLAREDDRDHWTFRFSSGSVATPR